MIWPNKRLKKVPLPWDVNRDVSHPWSERLEVAIRRRFVEMYGERSSISTSERIRWAGFLLGRQIVWEIKVRQAPNWDGWGVLRGGNCLLARPLGTDGHIKVNHYFIPEGVASKILVLGELV